MRTQVSILVPAALLALMAGCSSNTVSESQCIAGDWQTVGYRDGANGLRSTQLLKHQDACVKHDVIPDRASYMVGWKEGVQEYCSPHNGFDVGERGERYYNVCPSDLEHGFQSAYAEGRELYMARVAVANLERKIAQRERRLETVKAEIVSSATSQLDPELTAAERIDLVAYTQRLTQEQSRILEELPELEHELEHKSAELDHLTQTLAYR
jgi:hypothetical protein